MRGRYIVFDAETPNYADNRMSTGSVAVCSGDMLFNAFDEYLGFLT